MKLRVLYFASLREAVGIASETVDTPDDVLTVGQLRAWLRQRGGPWQEALAEGRNVRAALNQVMADAGQSLTEGAELAFFPPVTGG